MNTNTSITSPEGDDNHGGEDYDIRSSPVDYEDEEEVDEDAGFMRKLLALILFDWFTGG